MYLLDTNNIEDARLLLKHQTIIMRNHLFDKLDNDDNTLLHRYVLQNQADAVQLLLEYGASVYSVNKYGWLPMHLAAYCGHNRTIIQYLLEFEKR
jgi:ankyrin repeat protein